jgi:hypothetical protein
MKFEILADSIKKINDKTGNAAKNAVNQYMTLRNWVIGYYIIEYEQKIYYKRETGKRTYSKIK